MCHFRQSLREKKMKKRSPSKINGLMAMVKEAIRPKMATGMTSPTPSATLQSWLFEVPMDRNAFSRMTVLTSVSMRPVMRGGAFAPAAIDPVNSVAGNKRAPSVANLSGLRVG